MGQFLTHFTKYYPCRVCSDPMLPTPPAAQPPPTPQGPNVDVVPRGSISEIRCMSRLCACSHEARERFEELRKIGPFKAAAKGHI